MRIGQVRAQVSTEKQNSNTVERTPDKVPRYLGPAPCFTIYKVCLLFINKSKSLFFSGSPFLYLQNERLGPGDSHALSSANISSPRYHAGQWAPFWKVFTPGTVRGLSVLSENRRKIYFTSSGQPGPCCSPSTQRLLHPLHSVTSLISLPWQPSFIYNSRSTHPRACWPPPLLSCFNYRPALYFVDMILFVSI